MIATTRKLRIAIWHNLPGGGGKRALYGHVRGLLDRGHTVEAWCPPTADQSYLPLSQLIPEHIVPLAWDANRQRGPIARVNEIKDMIGAMHRHCQACAAEINGGGFSVLFANSCRLMAAAPIGRYVRLPRVLFLQEPRRPLYEASPRLPWAALPWPSAPVDMLKDFVKVQGLRLQAREEADNAAAFDVILANSSFSRESILRAYGLDARVCYLGVDTTIFVDQHKPREDFVIGVGAFAPEKNIEAVIDALAAMPAPAPRLVWVGNAVNQRYLERMRQQAQQRRVHFEPRLMVSDAELVDMLNRAAMMVYAPRLEPFGLVPLEANACATPVVAVAEGGVRETVVDGVNGLLVESDAHTIATAIQRLLADPLYGRQLGQNGVTVVQERWTLGAAVDRLEERLQEVVTTPQGSWTNEHKEAWGQTSDAMNVQERRGRLIDAPLIRRVAALILPRGIRRHIRDRVQPIAARNGLEGFTQAVPGQCAWPRASSQEAFFFPVIDWDYRFQRPQQLAVQFAAHGQRVFYLRTRFVDDVKGTPASLPLVKSPVDGVFEVILPGPHRINFYVDVPDAALTSQLFQALAALRQNCVIRDAISIVEYPFWWPVARRLREAFGWRIVYDCIDRHSGFTTMSAQMILEERVLSEQADLVVATSHLLWREQCQLNRNCVLIPNGTDFNHFSVRPRLAADVRALPRPIIGYYGAIAEWFATDMVATLAQRHRQWSFVLIGRTTGADLGTLPKQSNVYLLGEKPYSVLPAYAHAFDVCLIPFKRTPLTEATNPVKLYEYLSMGKPVVATDLPDLKDFGSLVYLAQTAEEFETHIASALVESPVLAERRIAEGKKHTWEARFVALQQAIAGIERETVCPV